MARRSDHTREELKEIAINAGKEIIASEGFSKFSARKLANKIGYTVGTIYNIFETHDDLILNINGVMLDDMKEFITENINRDLEGNDQIKYLASCYLEFIKINHARWSTLFEHKISSDRSLPSWYLEKIHDLFSVVESPLNDKIGDEKKAALSAKILWASIHGICALGVSGKLDMLSTDNIQLLMDNLIDNYFLGLSINKR